MALEVEQASAVDRANLGQLVVGQPDPVLAGPK